MLTQTLILTGIVLFFASFGVTLFAVSLWCNVAPAPRNRSVAARRPGEDAPSRGDASYSA
jgi:multisubunit Na+/H+ antiporter MnhC subunit